MAVSRAGIEPRAAVEALTRTPAHVLGIDHRFGTLAAGYAADLVVLDHEWRVLDVWADGRRLDRAER
jgi:N-acetylglucosamine-6-phosphate deacetylase